MRKAELGTLSGVMSLVDATLEQQGMFVFSRDVIPAAPDELYTGALIVSKQVHDYDGIYYCDVLRFVAQKHVYRLLSLLVLSSLFHIEPKRIRLNLTHTRSQIKDIIIDSPYYSKAGPDLVVVPHEFAYFPSLPDMHPFLDLLPHLSVRDLPCFGLTSEKDLTDRGESERNLVVGFGTNVAHVLLAQLLLNASSHSSTVSEYHLESEAGFRGVGVKSAEVGLLLPGSAAWEEP
jgi:hypothetical protein